MNFSYRLLSNCVKDRLIKFTLPSHFLLIKTGYTIYCLCVYSSLQITAISIKIRGLLVEFMGSHFFQNIRELVHFRNGHLMRNENNVDKDSSATV